MTDAFALLIQMEDLLLEEKISRWAPYEEAQRDMDGKWERLCAAHPGENREALALLDACDELVRQKGDAAFLLPGSPAGDGAGTAGAPLGRGGLGRGAGAYSLSLCRRCSMAFRSMRDTCTWETPSTLAARSWVSPL